MLIAHGTVPCRAEENICLFFMPKQKLDQGSAGSPAGQLENIQHGPQGSFPWSGWIKKQI